MASYDALINLRVKGLNDLNKIDSAINGITKGAKETTKTVKGANKVLMSQGLALRALAKRQNTLVEKFHRVTGKSKGGTMASFLLPDSRMLNASKRKIQELVTDQQKHINKVAQARQNAQKRALDGEKRIKIENQAVARSKAAADRDEIKRLEAIIKLRRLAAQAGRVGTKLGDVLAPPELNTRGKGGKMLALPSAEMRAGAPGAFQNAPGFRGTKKAPTLGIPKGVRSGGGSGVLQSALISGAFPLLFGQGLLGGVAGAAGGGIGAAMGGQMGGFAGGLVATAALQAITSTINGVKELGQALNPLTMDIGKLTQSLGIVGTEEARRLQLIQESQGKQAALAEATRSMALVIGDKGVQSIKKFSENMTAIGGSFSRFGLRLQAGFAELFNNILDQLKKKFPSIFNKTADDTKAGELTTSSLAANPAAQKLNTSISDLKGQEASILAQQANQRSPIAPPKFFDFLKGGSAMFPSQIKPVVEEQNVNAELDKQLIKIREKIKLQTEDLRIITEKTKETSAQTIKDENDKKQIDLTMKANKENVDLLEATLKGESEKFTINKKALELKKQMLDKGVQEKNINLESIKGDLEKEASLQRQVDLAKQLKSVLAEGMASAIEGLIQGTKSLGDSLRSVLQQFGSILLRTGISNMMGSSSLFGGFFGKGVGSAEGNYLANGIRPFASGGMVTRPTMGLVGEAGEDEYVIPASKMASSMQRYSAGARGQAVIPGTGSSSSGGAAGSSTNVTYSGPILNFNSEEFIPKSAIGQIINSAASKGAAAGESRTMSTLRNSRSARSRIGM